MGYFGKYVLKIKLSNGETGYFMEVMDGCITLTNHLDAACRFLTEGGAEGYYESIRDLEELISGAYIVNAWVCKANSL